MPKRESNGRGGFSGWWRQVMLGLVCGLLASVAYGQEPLAAGAQSGDLETTADRLNYDREKGIVEGVGNVVIKRGDVELRADYVRVDVNTEEAQAFGDVSLKRGEDIWTGPKLDYNFGTGASSAPGMALNAAPFYVRSGQSERDAEGVYVLQDAWASTCNPETETVDFHVTASRMELKPDEYLKAKHAVWWFGPVPTFYVPYWYRDLDGDFGFEFEPGYSSRWGAYLLSAYRYRLSPGMTGRTHLDYREERGVAVGQDLSWNYGGNQSIGKIKGYYADDDDPLEDRDIEAGKEIDPERYRIKFEEQYVLSPRDNVLARAHYLSDIDMLEDFFRDEYRQERQPDNYLSYAHRGDWYTASLLTRARLNDFYAGVNRLPEAVFDVYQQQIGESDFYYESRTAAAFLERVYEDNDDAEDYDSVRLDSEHTVYRPDKHFGFLTLIPRAGVRATHYSETRGDAIFTTTQTPAGQSVEVDANGVTNIVFTPGSTSTNFQGYADGGGDTRGLVELGFETSYKAFGLYDTVYGPRRHILEPFANYTFVPEPNVTPDQLYQFDDVDTLDEENSVRLGARNKWQEKRELGAYDLVDLEISTLLLLDPQDDQDSFESLFWDAEVRPIDGIAIESDGTWSVADSELDRFNVWMTFYGSLTAESRLEYRYRNEESSLFAADVTLFPKARWTFNGYGRYEAEESRLEEYGGYLKHEFTCLAVRLGASVLPGYERTDGSEEDDEYQVRLEFWLTAFPSSVIGATASN